MYIQNKLEVNGMLLQFKFSNYRCFADETIFNMAAAPIKDHKDSLREENGVYVLPVSGLYGANASGKSSFFMAFNRMRTIIVDRFISDSNNISSKESIFTTPFLFTGDPKNSKDALLNPTKFEATFSIESTAYRYGFECTQNKIISEWLYKQKISKNATNENLIYEVNATSNTPNIGKVNKDLKLEIEHCYSMRSDTSLLLSDFGNRKKIKDFMGIFLWFLGSEILLNDILEGMCRQGYEQFIGYIMEENQEWYRLTKNTVKDEISELIHEIDPCISAVNQYKDTDENGRPKYRLKAVHEINNTSYEIAFNAESDGTKKYLFLISVILNSLFNGTCLFVDEIDAKLHPLILRKIVQMYKNKEINKNNAQLIFSAHNIINLDSSDLRRDEIWFVEKNNQKSTMYSLYDFDDEDGTVRSDLDFGKHYLSGRFGAIPFQD